MTTSATTHALKVWPDYYPRIADGSKPFEIRYDDRGFQVGDVLHLREYAPGPDEYTGRSVRAVITYRIGNDTIPFGTAALKPGYCVLGISLIAEQEE